MEQRLFLKGLCCAQCAADMERDLRKMAGVRFVRFNFATGALVVETDDLEAVAKRVRQLLPEVEVQTCAEEEPGSVPSGFSARRVRGPLPVAGLLFLAGWVFSAMGDGRLQVAAALAFTGAWALAGWPVFRGAAAGIVLRRPFDEAFLMTIATLGALALRAFPEAAGVMLFYRVGQFLEDLAVARSRRSIRALLEARPSVAYRRGEGGLFEAVSPEEVSAGQVLRVRAGERVPLDGVVQEGEALLDSSPLTGESLPVAVAEGSTLRGGSVVMTGSLVFRATAPFSESSIARVLDLVENASSRKSTTERFITRFARVYTPTVVAAAIGIAFLPPLLAGASLATWAYRALVLLVLSCPCALVISIPLGFFGGIGAASARGILVKGASVLDVLARVRTVVFDKTGTLTQGQLKVRKVEVEPGFKEAEVRRQAASAEAWSSHPVGRALVSLVPPEALGLDVKDVKESLGRGLSAVVEGRQVRVGSPEYLAGEGVPRACGGEGPGEGLYICMAVDGVLSARFFLSDAVREEAAEAVAALRKAGVRKVVMLSGDREDNARAVAEELGLDAYRAGLLPEGKVEELERVLSSESAGEGAVAFVGDGLNDAPVLARADVGIAMGGTGTTAAMETADVILAEDRLLRVSEALTIAHRTVGIVRQNIVLALGIKALVLFLGVFGKATLWEAVFADVGVTLLAVANAQRILFKGPRQE